MNRLDQWLKLAPADRRALLHLMYLAAVVWFGLRTIGFVRMRTWAEMASDSQRTSATSDADLQLAQRCAALTRVVANRGMYRANCLHQALALCRLLRERELPAQLNIGAKPSTAGLDAHAWVELDGQVLGDAVEGYVAFDLPRQGLRN